MRTPDEELDEQEFSESLRGTGRKIGFFMLACIAFGFVAALLTGCHSPTEPAKPACVPTVIHSVVTKCPGADTTHTA